MLGVSTPHSQDLWIKSAVGWIWSDFVCRMLTGRRLGGSPLRVLWTVSGLRGGGRPLSSEEINAGLTRELAHLTKQASLSAEALCSLSCHMIAVTNTSHVTWPVTSPSPEAGSRGCPTLDFQPLKP